jgi:hypothetical protein
VFAVSAKKCSAELIHEAFEMMSFECTVKSIGSVFKMSFIHECMFLFEMYHMSEYIVTNHNITNFKL